MTLIALELPDEIRDWPVWLEQQLVGLRLRELVQQLELIGGETDEPEPAIESVLGDRRQAVLDEGLIVLEESQLNALVRHPRLLISMQEMVFIHGGPFWRTVPRTQEHLNLVSQQWLNLMAELDKDRAKPFTKLEGIRTEPELRTPEIKLSGTPTSLHRRWLIGLAALAATTLFIISVSVFQRTEGRFFAARDIRESQLVGKDHLLLVADRIQNDWISDLDDKRAFEKQLTELRNSCNTLLAMNLRQLDLKVAADLKKRCQNWKTEFSKHLAELASGVPLADVRAKSNALVDRLTQAIANFQ